MTVTHQIRRGNLHDLFDVLASGYPTYKYSYVSRVMGVVHIIRDFADQVTQQCRPLYIIIASGCVVVVTVVVHHKLKKKINLPPGPRPWPIIGNLPREYD